MGTLLLAVGAATATAGSVSLQLENDSFDGASDAYYTQGLQLTYIPDTPVSWPRKILPKYYAQREIHTRFSLGQAIFTPYEIEKTELIEDDRPYAGWLYLSGGLHTKHLSPERGLYSAERLDLNLGIVGPSAGAEQTQRWTHRMLDTYDVNGWHNQLRDEPTLMVSYARKWALIRALGNSGTGWELSAQLGGSAGNVTTQLATGLGLRLGNNLFASAGVSGLQPTTVAPDFSGSSAPGSWFLFADWQLRFVDRDIFLDGNSDKASHGIEKEPRVAELRFGGVFTADRYCFTLYHARRSQEFVGQYENANFSGLGLTVSF